MVTKTLVPTLALALTGVFAPTAAAVSITDNDTQLTLGVQLQARAEITRAKDQAGNDYNIETGQDFSKSDTASFYLRRARFAFKGAYKQVWGFNLTVRADGLGRGSTTAASSGPLVQQAFVYRIFRMDGWSQQVQIGEDYAFHNRAVNVVSSSELLLPNLPATAGLLNNRSAGIGYRFNSDLATFGADIQNNKNINNATGNTAAVPNKSEGLWYSARLELTGPGAWRIAKDTESFTGKPGTGVRLGLDVADNNKARVASGAAGTPLNQSVSTLDFGVDLLGHWDGLTILGESRWDTLKTTADTGASPSDSKREVWLIQAGYAFPMDGWAIEPAARYERIDMKNNPTTLTGDVYGQTENEDFGQSGRQVDVGLNFYWLGHNSKTQVEFSNWKPRATGSQAKANIFRIQEQLSF